MNNIDILIEGISRVGDIEMGTIIHSQTLSKEPSTLSFTVKGVKTQPSLGDEVVMSEGENDVFRGTIVERNSRAIGGIMVGYEYLCLDGYYILDSKLVAKAYSNTDAVTIVQDIIDTFANGITLDAPGTSPTITTARFNYEQPSRAIQKIANQIGWDWYIDASNVLHFFAPGEESAPFEVQDDNGTVIAGSLRFDSNIVELKNVIYVRGGEYLDPISEEDAIDKYGADGDQIAFPLVYRYSDVQVTLDGSPLTVGVDYIDSPEDFDVLYNFQEKMIRFSESNKPSVGEIVRVFGNAYVPLIVQARDVDSISAYTEREGLETDRTITSIPEAELVANALLDKWREGSLEGRFSTRSTGLRVGQSITINSTRFGINRIYKVNRIRGTMNTYDEFEYDVEFIASGQTTFTDIMIGLLGRDRLNIEISPDEVIQKILNVNDLFSMADEITEVETTSPPYRYASDTPGEIPNAGVYNFSTYS